VAFRVTTNARASAMFESIRRRRRKSHRGFSEESPFVARKNKTAHDKDVKMEFEKFCIEFAKTYKEDKKLTKTESRIMTRSKYKMKKDKEPEPARICRMRRDVAFEKKQAAKRRYLRHKVFFCKGHVSVKQLTCPWTRVNVRADQLVRHFTQSEIKRAAVKLMKKKEKFNF
jgi:predicted DNA-binding WGR domain protein